MWVGHTKRIYSLCCARLFWRHVNVPPHPTAARTFKYCILERLLTTTLAATQQQHHPQRHPSTYRHQEKCFCPCPRGGLLALLGEAGFGRMNEDELLFVGVSICVVWQAILKTMNVLEGEYDLQYAWSGFLVASIGISEQTKGTAKTSLTSSLQVLHGSR